MLLDKLHKLRSRHPSLLLIGRNFLCNNTELENYPGKCRICVLVTERMLEWGRELEILGALSANAMGTLLRLVAPCNFLVSTCAFLISGKFSPRPPFPLPTTLLSGPARGGNGRINHRSQEQYSESQTKSNSRSTRFSHHLLAVAVVLHPNPSTILIVPHVHDASFTQKTLEGLASSF
ncbi:uncharacterized protein LACBIDRAFT_308889 [Laccaria bicolor S238N-H82]|uniref:Predicted protein n=1 Tax=Laccaria bicolor (strain S238N-H82 / ATCC MYA-4686) TaxID=486041 RepID=B0CV04_LACBS|nr:uncharacterized protein LACBIDRAFT_308889 [Laccaria bicolor S238N-H82]EDR13662.1 predicted protein [Laccaria bicolor S238N-H82]|eukprot:XP_001876160.1 predicted protein [Laccaria bicolor S238N-H82]